MDIRTGQAAAGPSARLARSAERPGKLLKPIQHGEEVALTAGRDYQRCDCQDQHGDHQDHQRQQQHRGDDQPSWGVDAIAARGVPAPIQVGRRWVIERTHAWGNQYGKLRWCTERRRLVVEFWLALASAAIVCGRLVRRAWTHYRWQDRPRRRP
jgi:hypothetical protein